MAFLLPPLINVSALLGKTKKTQKSHLINAALKGFLESNQKLLDFLNIADLKLQHTHTFKSSFSGTTQASRYKYGFQ